MKLIHTADQILHHEFEYKMRGYDQAEVDQFLDEIINDYKTYDREIRKLEEENKRLRLQLEEATEESVYNNRQQTQTVTNFDILKRLSNLEKAVFGDKLK